MQDHRTKMTGGRRMTLSALLLAGGDSRRMGRDKATLEFCGRPLWKQQLETLRALRPARIFVSVKTAPGWLPDEVELLLDDSPSRGPLSGLAKALAAMETTHLAVLAIDMPFMKAAEMSELLCVATDGCGVVPTIAERVEPLAAIYPASAATDFRAALAGSDFSLQRIVRALAAAGQVTLCSIPQQRAHFYRNVNTPGDICGGDAAPSP